MLAYHVIAGILKRLKKSNINYTWNTIRNILNTHVRITTTFKTKNQEMISLRDSVLPNLSQREIYNALKITHNPLKKIKIKYSKKNV